jgi:hypothetical protein
MALPEFYSEREQLLDLPTSSCSIPTPTKA